MGNGELKENEVRWTDGLIEMMDGEKRPTSGSKANGKERKGDFWHLQGKAGGSRGIYTLARGDARIRLDQR